MAKALRGLAACLGVLAVCVPLVLWCASPADPGTTSTTSTVAGSQRVSSTLPASVTSTLPTRVSSTLPPVIHTTTTVAPAVKIRIAAVGDVLTHLQIIDSARDYRTGGYDFAPILAPIAPYLSAADYTIANLETRLAGAGEGFGGYPLLNSPDELAAGLKSAGIDLLATANNHSLDQGWEGVLATLDTVEAAGLAHVGTYRSQAERDVPFVVGVSGIKLAFLNYTAETNGLPLPRGREFAVGVLDPLTVAGDVRAARARGAELVIAILHYGNEYARIPSGSQVKVSEQLLAAGVDAIIGSHPHVVEPIERVLDSSDPRAAGKFVAYSLGNFISGQRWRYSDSGIVLYLDIEKDRSGARIAGVEYLPIYVERGEVDGRVQYRVVPVVPGQAPVSDLTVTAETRARMDQVWEELHALLDRPEDYIQALDPARLGLPSMLVPAT